MKSKTTFQKIDYTFIIRFLIDSLLAKKWTGYIKYLTIRNLFIIISSSFLFSYSSYGQSNNCNAKITVENNGYTDSASATEGVLYKMIITNNSTSTDTYILSSVNVNSNSKNPDDSATNPNVTLNTIFLDTQKNTITEVTLDPRESIHFFSKLTIPSGTTPSKWSNNQILATSTRCSSYKVDTILYTYVLNPNNN